MSNLITKIKERQLQDESWGSFHSLLVKSGFKFTTEQALRELLETNHTIDD